ncbi:hypothetical protein QJQ45_001814 [Haematococcus lacustris]|nr:hypothetical protein QJQ45_001814 [Haematococcus lacustris]
MLACALQCTLQVVQQHQGPQQEQQQLISYITRNGGLVQHVELQGRELRATKARLWLLWHQVRGTESPLEPHLRLLPGRCPGVALPGVGMLLHPDALQELQYAPLQEDVLNHKYWREEWWRQELAALAGSAHDPFNGLPITAAMFGQAVAVTISRSFGLRRAGSHSMPALIDMLDHAFHANCEISSDLPSGAISLHTTKQVQPGEVLRLTYGPHPNTELLLSYGFVVSDNPHDVYEWDFDYKVLADIVNTLCGEGWVPLPLPQWKRELLLGLGLGFSASEVEEEGTPQGLDTQAVADAVAGQRVKLGGSSPAAVEPRLLAAVRLLLLQDGEAASIQAAVQARAAQGSLGDWAAPLARQHEVGVMKAMQALVSALYQAFPTTIQEDRLLLKQLEPAGSPAPPTPWPPTSHPSSSPASTQQSPASNSSSGSGDDSSGCGSSGSGSGEGRDSSGGRLSSDHAPPAERIYYQPGPQPGQQQDALGASGRPGGPGVSQQPGQQLGAAEEGLELSLVESLRLAVSFRLQLKLALERCLIRLRERRLGTIPELAVPAGAPPQQQQQLAAASTSRKREAPAANKSRAAKQGATNSSVAKRARAARLAWGEFA